MIRPTGASPELGIRYGTVIALGAFLLFQVQPLLGSYVLPWFGGASSVWTSCLLFFQTLLVAGYLYAHLISRLSLSRQVSIHLVLVIASLFLLPVTPSDGWKHHQSAFPVIRILGLLAVTVGVPYLLLSTTGPLLQGWFARETRGRSPYRFYALSNAASLLGLLTYPFLIQPRLEREMQTVFWSWGYGLFVLACVWCGVRLLVSARSERREDPVAPLKTREIHPRSTSHPRFLWLALPACASVLLLGVTNQVTAEVATVPFLWVLPLVLYLGTFILCFEADRWYSRRVMAPLLVLCLLANTTVSPAFMTIGWVTQIVLASATVFVCCMVCHGELARIRPNPRHLTGFYLVISVGGALGGVLVALVAPLVFPGFWEVPLGLWMCLMLFLAALYRDPTSTFHSARRPRAWQGAAVGMGLIGPGLLIVPLTNLWNFDVQVRTFYGVLQIAEEDEGTTAARRIMTHGNTLHGAQFLAGERMDQPTAYYGPGSGVGLVFENHARRREERPLRVGAIGLGVGTVACWLREGDSLRFYEIDPMVLELANTHFTFLQSARGSVEVVIGDGRIALERDLARELKPLDLLVVDAFAEGSIPVHLLTRECFEIYWRALAPDGVLAVHVSNNYLDLALVVRGAARALGKQALQTAQRPDPERALKANRWVLMAADLSGLRAAPEIESVTRPWRADAAAVLWTDRHSSLLQVLR